MPRIPAYQRVASIPGPQGMAMPRATPAAMGSLEGAAMERGGANISDYVLDENDKKITAEAQIYAAKTLSAVRAKFAKREVHLRRTTDSDIAPVLDSEFATEVDAAQRNAPNPVAADKVAIGLQTFWGTLSTRAIYEDSVFRDKRVINSNTVAHENDQSAVYNNYGVLNTTIAASKARVNALVLPDVVKQKMIQDQKLELGYDGVRGYIDVGPAQASQMLKDLNDPTNDAYFKNILGDKKQQLIKYANSEIKAFETSQRLNETARRMQETQDQRDINTHWVDRLLNPAVGVTMEEIRTYEHKTTDGRIVKPNGGTIATLKNHFNTLAKPPITTSEEKLQTFSDLMEQVDYIKSDPESYGENVFLQEIAIEESLAQGDIGLQHYNVLIKNLNKPLDGQKKLFLDVMKQELVRSNGMLGIKDPEGTERYMQAVVRINELLEQAEQNEDINIMDLYDPKSDLYMKKDSEIAKLKRTDIEIQHSLIYNLTGKKRPTGDGKKPPTGGGKKVVPGSTADNVLRILGLIN